MEPQPQLPAVPDVFLIRHVLHNLSDKYAIQLLKHLREVSKPSSKLLVIDTIVQYACPVSEDVQHHTGGFETAPVPSPLLPNMGVAAALPYDLDLLVSTLEILATRALLDIYTTDAE